MQKFTDLGLSPEMLKVVEKAGFQTPTPIQEAIIPQILEQSQDLIGLAQTGTGKTAAFGLPIRQLLDNDQACTQALILCPTRELCLQVCRDLKSFAPPSQGADCAAIYGGAGISQQSRQLRRGARIIVATPGRLLAFIRQGEVRLENLKMLILDEADEMLRMGFKEDLEAILSETPAERRTLLFSATMPAAIKAICKKYMKQPRTVAIDQDNPGAGGISHSYVLIKNADRYPALKRIIDSQPGIYAIIFCRTRQETREVAEQLLADGHNAEALHGDLSQEQRDLAMQRFHRQMTNLLIATDVAARGLDIKNLSHVINYKLPEDNAAYTHRTGRTGRAGEKGSAISLVSPQERYRVRILEKQLKLKMTAVRIEPGREICRRQIDAYLKHLVETIETTPSVKQFIPEALKKLENLSREELVAKLLQEKFAGLTAYYENAPDLNMQTSARPAKTSSGHGRPRDGLSSKRSPTTFSRFRLNVGKRDGLTPGRLIGQINDCQAKGVRINIGRVDIRHDQSIIESDQRFDQNVAGAFAGVMINGRPVQIEKTATRVEQAPAGRRPRPGKRLPRRST